MSWVFKIRSLDVSVHLDEYPLLKCSRGMLYALDDFEKTFLNYLVIMMMRSYDGMLMRANSSINILICLYLI